MSSVKPFILFAIAFSLVASYAAKNDVVDRVFDLSDRLVLVKDEKHFYFERCHRAKCKRISKKMLRNRYKSLSKAIEQERVAAGLTTAFPFRPHEMVRFFDNTPWPSRIVFAYSLVPERFNIACRNDSMDGVIRRGTENPAASWEYRFTGEGQPNGCVTQGEATGMDLTFNKFISHIGALEKIYDKSTTVDE